jgi:lambda family phage tail tape measure protein
MSDNKIVIDSADVTKATVSLKELSSQLGVSDNAATQFEGSIKKMATAFKAASANPFTTSIVLLTAALGGATYAIKSMFDSYVTQAAALDNLSKKTGVAVEQLSIMQSVARLSGTSMDTVTGAIIKFEKSLAASATATSLQSRAFKALGIDTSDTSKTTEQYMYMAAQKLEGLHEGWQKNNIVMALFGKNGTDINEFLADYANKGELAAKVTKEQAAMAEEYERTMKKLSATANQYKALIGAGLLPVMESLAKEILNMSKQSGTLDTESKKLVLNDIEQWGWDTAHGLAAVSDFMRNFITVMKVAGQETGLLALASFKAWMVLDNVRNGNLVGAYRVSKEIADVVGSMKEASNALTDKNASFFTDMVDKAEAARKKFKGSPADTTEPKPTPKNVGTNDDKIDTSNVKDLTGEYIRQADAVTKLWAEYFKLLGVEEQTAEQMFQNAVNEGKYNEVVKDGKVIKEAATAEELKRLRAGAIAEDQLKELIKTTKELLTYEKQVEEAYKRETEISSKKASQQVKALLGLENEVALYKIQLDVMKKFGATQGDVTVKQLEYNLQKAQELYYIKERADFSEEEQQDLLNEIQLLERKIEKQKTVNDLDSSETARQRQFSYGWEQSFKKYEEDAFNASKNAETVFGTASKGMEDAMVNFAMTGKLSFSSMAQSILADIARIAARKAISSMFAMFTGSADGNVFAETGILKSASGNVFDKPTLHGYSGGIGMLGEAGPEAIMPLSRGPNGKLGVVSQGGGGAQINNISVSVSVQGGTTNDQTGNAVAAKITEQFTRGIVRQELMAAKRTGGILNPV